MGASWVKVAVINNNGGSSSMWTGRNGHRVVVMLDVMYLMGGDTGEFSSNCIIICGSWRHTRRSTDTKLNYDVIDYLLLMIYIP